jgi:8-oxo-dGTP diphosphatase
MNQFERAGHDALIIHRDSAETKRPSVDIRVVLFTLASGELLVGRSRDERSPGLPRDVPVRSESLDVTARRIVLERLSIQEQYIEQLYTLSIAEPIDGWSVIVAYLALVCSSGEPVGSESISWEPAADVAWISDTDRLVTDYAITRLRAKLGYTNVAFHLLPPTFTLTELQHAYEAILRRRVDKRNFRRRMISSGILDATDDKRREGSHRPAVLYRFRADLDTASYLTPSWSESHEGVLPA